VLQHLPGFFVSHFPSAPQLKYTKIKQEREVSGLDLWKLLSNNCGMKEQPSKRGGKRPGAGRPPKPPEERRDQVFSIKLTADEKALLEETDARSWSRDVLLKAARRRVK
jgi:hypothetical protein